MWVKLSSLLPLSVRGSPAAGGRHGLPDGSLPIRSRSRAASTQRQQAAAQSTESSTRFFGHRLWLPTSSLT